MVVIPQGNTLARYAKALPPNAFYKTQHWLLGKAQDGPPDPEFPAGDPSFLQEKVVGSLREKHPQTNSETEEKEATQAQQGAPTHANTHHTTVLFSTARVPHLYLSFLPLAPSPRRAPPGSVGTRWTPPPAPTVLPGRHCPPQWH